MQKKYIGDKGTYESLQRAESGQRGFDSGAGKYGLRTSRSKWSRKIDVAEDDRRDHPADVRKHSCRW